MIEFQIDGQAVELPPDSSVTLSARLNELTDPAGVEVKKYPVVVPMTPNNRAVMGFVEQTLSPGLFNQTLHYGKIGCRGTTLVQGEVELVRCENDPDGSGRYVLNLLVKPPEWIRSASRKKLRDTLLPYEETYGQELIRASWTSGSPVKFLPVKRDVFPAYGQNQTTLRLLGHDNYHPFVQIYALLNAIAGENGYRIASEFLGEPFFQSLYMSGNYPEGAGIDASFTLDFQASRTAANKTTTANAEGKVFATSLQSVNSVGNPVDSEDAYTGTDLVKKQYFGACFQMVNNRPVYVPDQDVIVGFEFQMQFSCAQTILSPQKISLPATVKWDGETIFAPPTTDNPLIDVKKNTNKKGDYTCFFFHFPNAIRYLIIKFSGGSENSYSVSSAQQTFSIVNDFVSARYQYYSGSTLVSSEEWVMYDNAAFSALPTEQNYQIAVRTQPKLRKKNETVYFDTLTFEGGSAGSSFTFYRGATVRPLFYGTPENGTKIAFSSLFHHDDLQIKLVQAMQHLFGLHFYTDELTKTIYIEPRFTFLNQTHEIDWSEKIDYRKSILVEEWGSEYYEWENFRYRSGDATVDRQNEASGFSYGQWSAAVAARSAKSGEKNRTNPLFTATCDEKNSLIGAPAASMIVVGNRNEDETQKSFPAKIVRYLGMKALPAGQKWGWPAESQQYPLVMFHSAGEDWYTLCFDNEGGQLGLKNYIQPIYDTVNRGKKLTLFLRLSPSDMEAVLHPNSAGHDFRGNFRFNIRGETIRGRLVEVSGYNPAEGGLARCVFSVEL